MIETPTKPQFEPLSMPSKKFWANILSGAAVMERPDWIIEKKLVIVNSQGFSFNGLNRVALSRLELRLKLDSKSDELYTQFS